MIWFPSVLFFFFSLMKDHLARTIKRPLRRFMCSRVLEKKRRSLLISRYPEAQPSLFLLVKLLLLTSGCFSQPALLKKTSLLIPNFRLTNSVHPSIPFDRLRAEGPIFHRPILLSGLCIMNARLGVGWRWRRWLKPGGISFLGLMDCISQTCSTAILLL